MGLFETCYENDSVVGAYGSFADIQGSFAEIYRALLRIYRALLRIYGTFWEVI